MTLMFLLSNVMDGEEKRKERKNIYDTPREETCSVYETLAY